jgi:catechol 2,3-dioxygenase-like lactoylglutathione lyase family enzyme
MRIVPLFQMVDAVTVPVPDLDSGLRFYRDSLGHELLWRHDDIGQAGLGIPGSRTEIVLATGQEYASGPRSGSRPTARISLRRTQASGPSATAASRASPSPEAAEITPPGR